MAWFYDTTQREDEIFPPEESFIAEGEILVEKWIPKEVKISIENNKSQFNKLEHYEINT